MVTALSVSWVAARTAQSVLRQTDRRPECGCLSNPLEAQRNGIEKSLTRKAVALKIGSQKSEATEQLKNPASASLLN
jgi:hypothetical protein